MSKRLISLCGLCFSFLAHSNTNSCTWGTRGGLVASCPACEATIHAHTIRSDSPTWSTGCVTHEVLAADMPGACQQGPYGHGLAVPYRKTAPRKGIDWQGRSRPASEASTPHSSPALKGEASCAGVWPTSRQSSLSCSVKVAMKRSRS